MSNSELEICYGTVVIYLSILKVLDECIKRWWVDPFEG